MTIDPLDLIILSIRWAANQVEDWEQSVALHGRAAALMYVDEGSTSDACPLCKELIAENQVCDEDCPVPLCGELIDDNRRCDEDCPVGIVRKLSDPPVRVES